MTIFCQCIISSNTKYYLYHIIVFLQFILTIMRIQYIKYDTITGFILSTIIIQLLLFCCINIDNSPIRTTTCDLLFVGYTYFASIFIIFPYLLINIKYLKHILNIDLNVIYFINLILYLLVVVFIINTYYMSNSKFQDIICTIYRPPIPSLPKIHIPTVTMPTIVIKPEKSCNICSFQLNNNNKKVMLTCKHTICENCIKNIQEKLCPYCRSELNVISK